MKYENHSIEDLMKVTLSTALSLIAKEDIKDYTIYLSIDDTIQPKFGEKFD